MTLTEIREAYANHLKTGCMISPATWAEMVGDLLPMAEMWQHDEAQEYSVNGWSCCCVR
jgi:hypothetical protein